MGDELPDVTGMRAYIRIGVFAREDGVIVRKEMLAEADVVPIVEEHADRNRFGIVIQGKHPADGNGITLGFVEGLPIVLRVEGEIHAPERAASSDRFEKLVGDLCRELGCSLCLQTGERTSRLIRLARRE